MLRRFNSLMKIPKVPHEPIEHVHLRPALSVDSASIRPPTSSYGVALEPLHLPQAWVCGGEEEDGQASVINQTAQQGGDLQETKLPITQVNEEGTWKDALQYRKLGSHDAGNFSEQLSPANKLGYENGLDPNDASFGRFGQVDPSISELVQRAVGDSGETMQLESQSGKEFAFPVLPLLNGTSTGIEQETSDTISPIGIQRGERGFTTIDISDLEPGKAADLAHIPNGYTGGVGGPNRTISTFSTDSMTECCRICQQHTEEQLIELGCFCRGELAKAHRSCIEQWFSNKGTNKCEVCQHIATNISPPLTQAMPHFWVWRVGGPYAMGTVEVPQGGARRVGPFFGRHIAIQPVLHTILKRHPCTIFVFMILLIFVTCLFVDAIRTATFGYAAVPIGFLFGKLRLMF